VSSAICWSVAPMSEVRVVVMDCTDTGAPPPTVAGHDVLGGGGRGEGRVERLLVGVGHGADATI
ncbi:hypothetical protein, partial [Streptomyces sp. NPDC044948]|uniref:hypothetical protein n=1 Tax=Streptomyces sp. NPDC044948 TaxID=3157092 RepID=UPI0033E2E2D3